jgi:hypothetical protein
LKPLIKRWLWVFVIGLVAFFVVIVLPLRTRTETGGRDRAEIFLKGTRLGPIPATATNVLFCRWGDSRFEKVWMRFELPPGDIERFVTNSPVLSGMEPKEVYDEDHVLIPYPEAIYGKGPVYYVETVPPNARFFARDESAPDWYVTTISGKGRMYFLRPNAWLHIDEEHGLVWFKLVGG